MRPPPPQRRRFLSRCMFCRRWMWRRLERYCERCYRDVCTLMAREVFGEDH